MGVKYIIQKMLYYINELDEFTNVNTNLIFIGYIIKNSSARICRIGFEGISNFSGYLKCTTTTSGTGGLMLIRRRF
jgi:hypothetical protein